MTERQMDILYYLHAQDDFVPVSDISVALDRTDPSADGTSACTDGKGFHPVRPGIRNIDYHIKISNRSKKDCTDKKCGLFF